VTGEIVALLAAFLLPAVLLLGTLAVISLGLAGLAAAELEEGRLLRD